MAREFRGLLALLSGLALLSCSAGDVGTAGRAREGSWGGPTGGGPSAEERAISVRGYEVSRGDISTYLIANTSLEAIRGVTVYSRLNAIVSELGAEEGLAVKAGDVLARLDDREIRNEFEQAKIALDQARLAVQQAEVKAQLSASSFDRSRALFQQRLTSQQEYDQAELTNRTDSLAFETAKEQLESARARLDAARIQLDYTALVSPISGIVTQRMVDVGDRVNVNEAVFAIEEFPPLWARIYAPERELPKLRLGQPANVRIETYPERKFTGQIKMISPIVDPTSGTVKVTIELTQPGPLLRPGMFGTVYIATETRPLAIVAPKKSIVRERDLNYIFVINEDNSVSRREISLGFSDDSWVEVAKGVEVGEKIVTVGHESLSDGYAVNVQAWEGPEGEVPALPPRRIHQGLLQMPLERRCPVRTGSVKVAAGASEGSSLNG